jgi:uncharacterized protein (TIGR02996 family)
VTTLTPDLLAHVAAVRDGACDDHDLLVLADHLAEADDEDRAELVRVQVALERRPGNWPEARAEVRQRLLLGQISNDAAAIMLAVADSVQDSLQRRERDLLARNPAWLSVPCPECDGSGRNEYTLSGNCSLCKGAKDLLKRFVDDRTWATEPSATITRGFLDVTLHRTLCWRAEDLWDKGEPETVPHPVLRAVLASPVGPWVRRVRVEGIEPTLDEGGWEWYGLPDPLCTPETKDTFATAEAAADALSLAVPRWARGAK